VAAGVIAIVYGCIVGEARARRTPLAGSQRCRVSQAAAQWKLLYGYALSADWCIFSGLHHNYGVRRLRPFNPKWYAWDIVLSSIHHVAGAVSGAGASSIDGAGERGDRSKKPQFRGRGAAIFALLCLLR